MTPPRRSLLDATRLALLRLIRLETRYDRRIFVAVLVCLAWLSGWAVLRWMG